MEEKKNDFFATLVKNPDLNLADLNSINITPDNSSLLSKDEYLGMQAVRDADAFKGDDGKFDQKKFDNYYKQAQILYSEYSSDTFLDNLSENLTYGEDEWFAPKDAPKRDSNPIIVRNQIPTVDATGIAYLTETTPDGLDLSIREQAQREKIVDFETGEEFDYSPNDKAGLFSRYTLPTVVIAQWDEDGYHEENGVQIEHKAGDLKLNKRGRPYYETLGNREIYNKDVLRMSDVLTVDGSTWNTIDFFDSDDKEKSIGKVAMNLVARVAPMFIPGIGEIYGYLTATEALARVLPTVGKATNSILGGNKTINDTLNAWEGYMARFDPTASDYGREHLVSVEGLGNMIGDVSGQLFQQRAVSTIPSILKKITKSSKDVTQISRNLSLAYMAATSVQDTYGDFKNAGASDMMAGLGMWASMLSIYGLMHTDYFRDNFWKDTFMDESDVRGAVRGAAKETADKLAGAAQVTTTKEAASFVQKFSNFYEKNLLNAMQKKGAAGVIARGLSEGTEEVMEEATTDAVKALTEGLNALGIPVTKKDTELDFGWSGEDFATRYLSSAVGGFIGGTIFAGQARYEKWLNKKLYKLPDINPTNMERLVYMIATGQRSQIDSYLDKWYKKGVLGDKNMTIDGRTEFKPDGSSVFVPDGKGIDQNTAVYETLKNVLDTIQQTIESEVDVKYLTPEGFEQLTLLGYNIDEIKKNPQLIGASTLVALKDYGSFQNDLYNNLTKLVETKIALEARIKELNVPATTEDEKKKVAENLKNDATIKKLQEDLKKFREKKDDLFAGKYNKYYSGQAFFAANKNLYENFTTLDKETYVKLRYSRNYDSYTDDQKKTLDTEFDDYTKVDGRNNIYKAYDLYLDLSKKFGPKVEPSIKKLETALKNKNLPENTIGKTVFSKQAELEKEKAKLLAIDEKVRTPEQITRLSKIGVEINENKDLINLISNNPAIAEIAKDLSLDADFFKNLADDKGKINIYDDVSATKVGLQTSTSSASLLNETKLLLAALRKQYKSDANSGKYRYDDNALTFLFNKVVTSFKKNVGVENAFEEFFREIHDDPDNLYDDSSFKDELITQIELDPLAPMWTNEDPIHISNKTEILRLINEVLDNAGGNNAVAKAAYDALLQEIGKTSRLLEPLNKKFLDHLLKKIFPSIDGSSIIDLMNEFDEYRSKINYSAFAEIAKEIGVDLVNSNLFELVQQESMKLANSGKIRDYIINNPVVASSLSNKALNPIVKAITAIITGASDGTNAVINNFKVDNDKMPKLLEISKDTAKMILKQGNEFIDRIELLRAISDSNGKNTIRKHKETTINMRPKFLNAVLNIAGSIKDKLGIDVKPMWNGPDTVDESNFADYEKKCIEFEQAFHEAIFAKYPELTEPDKQKELANLLLSLVDGSKLYRAPSTILSTDEKETVSELDLIYYLATIASLPTKNFYAAYKANLDKELLPIPGHEFTIKQAVAEAINPYLFNSLIDGIKNNANYDGLNDDIKKYLTNKSVLHNLVTILGGAGTGKTVGVVVNIIKSLCYNVDTEVVFIAKEQNQADNIMAHANAGLTKVKAETVDDYCTKVFGEAVSKYKFDDNTYHVTSDSTYNSIGSEFDINSKLKILVIDEIETLTEAELTRICSDAEDNGILVIGAGDLKQPPTTVADKTSGVEDCYFIRTPELDVSMRAMGVAKYDNAVLLGRALNEVLKAAQTNPELNLNARDGLVDASLKGELSYYYNSETGEIMGDMITKDNADFDDKIQKALKLSDDVAIIVDSDKVAEYKAKYPGADIVPYERRAGGEWDYVFVDADLKTHNRDHKYLLTQDLYTLTQRSRLGTLIKSSDLDSFKFKNDPNKKGKITLNNDDKNDFRNWRFDDCLGDIEKDETALENIVSLSPFLNHTSNTTNTSTNPPTNPNPPTNSPSTPPTNPNPSGGPTPSGPTNTPSGPTQPTGPTTLPNSPTPMAPNPSGPTPRSNPPTGATNTSPSSLQNGPTPPTNQLSVSPTTPPVVPSSTNPMGESTNVEPTTEPEPSPVPTIEPPTEPVPSGNSEPEQKLKAFFNKVLDALAKGDRIDIKIKDLLNTIKESLIDVSALRAADSFDNRNEAYNNTSLADFINSSKDKRNDLIDLLNKCGFNGKAFVSSFTNPAQKEINNFTTGSSALNDNKVRHIGVKKDFTKIELKQPTSDLDYHDVRNIIKDIPDNDYKDMINVLGSAFRLGFDIPRALELTSVKVPIKRKLKNFIQGQHKLFVLPADGGAMLVGRLYNGVGEFFDIPLMQFKTIPSVYGEYKGDIKLIQKFKLEKGDGSFVKLDEMRANDQITINDHVAVINIPSSVNLPISNLDESSNDYLTNHSGWRQNSNMGKPIVTVTDEPILAKTLMNLEKHGYMTENGKTLQEYGRIDLMGIQCITSIEQFLDLIEKYKLAVNWNQNQLKVKLAYENPTNSSQESNGVAGSNVLDDIKFLKDDEGRIRQLLPYTRAGKLSAAALYASANARFSLNNLLRTVSIGQYKNTYTVKINDDFEFGFYNGKFVLGKVNETAGSFEPSNTSVTFEMDANTGEFDFNKVMEFVNQYDPDNADKLPIVRIGYYSKKQGSPMFSRDAASNWTMALLIGSIEGDTDINNFKRILSGEFKNGVYMDDRALERNTTVEQSVYSDLDTGNRTYYTDKWKIANFSMYGIDFEDITPIGNSNPTPPGSTRGQINAPTNNPVMAPETNPTVQPENSLTAQTSANGSNNPTAQPNINPETQPTQTGVPENTELQWIKENYPTLNVNSIEELNKKLKEESNDWIYDQVGIDESGYYVYNINNVEEWLKKNYDVTIDYDKITGSKDEVNEELSDYLCGLSNNSLDCIWGICMYKDANGNIMIKNVNDKIQNYVDSFYMENVSDLMSDYLASKIFNVNVDQDAVINELIKTFAGKEDGLDFLNLFVKFEDEFEC